MDKSFCCVRPGFAASVGTVLANLVAINEKSFLGWSSMVLIQEEGWIQQRKSVSCQHHHVHPSWYTVWCWWVLLHIYIDMQKVGNQSNKSFEKSKPASYPAQELVQSELLVKDKSFKPQRWCLACLAPSGITKGLGFKPIGVHVKLLPALSQWALTWVLPTACQVGSAVVFFFWVT